MSRYQSQHSTSARKQRLLLFFVFQPKLAQEEKKEKKKPFSDQPSVLKKGINWWLNKCMPTNSGFIITSFYCFLSNLLIRTRRQFFISNKLTIKTPFNFLIPNDLYFGNSFMAKLFNNWSNKQVKGNISLLLFFS